MTSLFLLHTYDGYVYTSFGPHFYYQPLVQTVSKSSADKQSDGEV